MAKARYAIGVDYGTNSVRALVIDVDSGEEIASHVVPYPSGSAGILLDKKDPNLARQNPADYVSGFLKAVSTAVRTAAKTKKFDAAQVVGLGIDTTGSTPIPVAEDGTPLAWQPRFKKNLAAQAWLWKDHTAHEEAAIITETAKKTGAPYLAKCGGTYSSEWFWSKIWHCQRAHPEVFRAAHSWVECCDFVPAVITGNLDPRTMKRSICAAGHKAMYAEAWGGLPSREFLGTLSPELGRLRERLYEKAVPSDQPAGRLNAETARKTGLPVGIPVAVGAFDAHTGAVGAGIRPGVLVKIIGTSTCDMMVAPGGRKLPDIPGLCGIVPGSILPGSFGLEAGQSAVGDIFNWFVSHLCPPEYAKGDRHVNLTRVAEKIAPGASGLIALDWNNGNRTILVDPLLSGLLVGQTLHTTAPEIYRALVEATAFGALTIIRRFEEYGVEVREVVNCGGIAEKNAFVMQIYADVLDRPMKISRSSQTCALGSAIFGAVVGGAYRTAEEAQGRIAGAKTKVYRPIAKNAAIYGELYAIYRRLHDAFGQAGWSGSLDRAMKDLFALRERTRKG